MRIIARLAALAAIALTAACSTGGAASRPTPYVAPPPQGGFTVSPSAVSFATAPLVQTILASEVGYKGAFTTSLACTPTAGTGAVATVTPTSASPVVAGQPVTFTVQTGVAPGTCVLTVTDAGGNSEKAQIASTIPPIEPLMVTPRTLTASTPATDVTFTVQEGNYGGVLNQFFSATSSCTPSGIAYVTSSAFAQTVGGPATFYVNASAAGSCTITIRDGFGQTATLPVTIH